MNTRRSWLLAGLCLVFMAVTALVLARTQSGHRLGKPGLRLASVAIPDDAGGTAATESIFLPERILDYRSEILPITRLELGWLPRDTTYGRRLYTGADGYQVQVSGVLMGTDRTSIHKPEFCLPGQGFQIRRRSPREILIERPHRYALPVTRIDALREIRKPDGTVIRHAGVFVYWFLSDTRLSNDHFQRMWWLALDLVRTGELQRWGYLSCLAPCLPGQEDAAYARVEALIRELVPEIQTTTGPALAAGRAADLKGVAP